MMRESFRVIFALSLSGSVLILMLLLLRPLLQNRCSRRWQYYIWLIVIARLLLPAAPAYSPAGNAVLSLENAAVSAIGYDSQYGAADSNPAFDAEFVSPEPSAMQEFVSTVWGNLWVIWLIGTLTTLIRKITAYQSFARFIRTGWKPVDDPDLLDQTAVVGAEIGVTKPVALFVNPLAASPMLLGFRMPCVVLPSTELSREDLRYVLLHELTHFRRKDALYKWLLQITLCIHWFNPLVHWMCRECERLGELSCDEAVLKSLKLPERRAYGDALLHAVAAGGGYKAVMPSAMLGESGKLLRERLEAIMNFKKQSKLAAGLSLLLAGMLSFTAVAAGAYTGVSVPSTENTDGQLWADSIHAEGRFTLDAYYQAPYLFEIGWNCSTQEEHSVAVALPDGSKMNVWFPGTVAALGLEKDQEALKALSDVIEQIWRDAKDSEFPLTSPVVWFYQNTGNSTTAQLAEEYYRANNLPAFKTSFSLLTNAEQKTWLEKIYADNDIAFFSAAVDGLPVDEELVKAFAEKTYADRAISFFSVTANRLSKDALEFWLEQAESDRYAACQSILIQRLGQDEKLEKFKDELDQKLKDEYKTVGVTSDGKNYYYQGKLVNIFLDQRQNSSFFTLDMNPNGSVNIKIVRNADNKITGVAYLSQNEAAELFEDWDD